MAQFRKKKKSAAIVNLSNRRRSPSTPLHATDQEHHRSLHRINVAAVYGPGWDPSSLYFSSRLGNLNAASLAAAPVTFEMAGPPNVTRLATYTTERTFSGHLNYFEQNGTFLSLQQTLGADLVVVYLHENQISDSEQFCGKAFRPTTLSSTNRSLSLAVINQSCPSSTTTHEVGHLMSMTHHWSHVCEDLFDIPGDSPSVYPDDEAPRDDIHGHVDSLFRTVMTTCRNPASTGDGGAFFASYAKFSDSNESVSLLGNTYPFGKPIGSYSNGKITAADNSKVLLAAAPEVAQYFPISLPPPPPPAIDFCVIQERGDCINTETSFSLAPGSGPIDYTTVWQRVPDSLIPGGFIWDVLGQTTLFCPTFYIPSGREVRIQATGPGGDSNFCYGTAPGQNCGYNPEPPCPECEAYGNPDTPDVSLSTLPPYDPVNLVIDL